MKIKALLYIMTAILILTSCAEQAETTNSADIGITTAKLQATSAITTTISEAAETTTTTAATTTTYETTTFETTTAEPTTTEATTAFEPVEYYAVNGVIEIPPNYDGFMEFEGLDGEILSIEDAIKIIYCGTKNYGKGEVNEFDVHFDFNWIKNGKNGEYQKVREGDDFYGYKVEYAQMVYEGRPGWVVHSVINLAGDFVFRGYIDVSMIGGGFGIGCKEEENDFAPIQWKNQMDRRNKGFGFATYLEGNDPFCDYLIENGKTYVEIESSSIQLLESSRMTSANSLGVKSVKIIDEPEG